MSVNFQDALRSPLLPFCVHTLGQEEHNTQEIIIITKPEKIFLLTIVLPFHPHKPLDFCWLRVVHITYYVMWKEVYLDLYDSDSLHLKSKTFFSMATYHVKCREKIDVAYTQIHNIVDSTLSHYHWDHHHL